MIYVETDIKSQETSWVHVIQELRMLFMFCNRDVRMNYVDIESFLELIMSMLWNEIMRNETEVLNLEKVLLFCFNL